MTKVLRVADTGEPAVLDRPIGLSRGLPISTTPEEGRGAELPGMWPKVKAALEDSRWDFRTVEGVARETGLTREHVTAVLDRHKYAIRKVVLRRKHSRAWRPGYTLKSRPRKVLREFLSDVLRFASR